MHATPISPAGGAIVEGIDLLGIDADAEAADALTRLLAEHHVLVFRGQPLDAERHVAIGRVFGDPYVHPYLDAVPEHEAVLEVLKTEHDADTFGGEFWHVDISFEAPPAAVSLLRGIELPAMGGDTLFANQHLAFDRLSSGLQATLRELRAIHRYPGMSEADASATHPVVRQHPRTARPAIYVNPAFVERFEGWTVDESRPLLRLLFEHSVRPEFQFRVDWQPDQLTVWDNRSVQHYAMNDYPGQRRRLERVTVIERS